MSDDEKLANLLAKQSLWELGCRYARAIDRMDRDLLSACYWPDATEDRGNFKGTAQEFCDWVLAFLANWKSAQHSITNFLVEMEGDEAFSETYFTACYSYDLDGLHHSQISVGRYLDRYARREGEWRILHRTAVLDWVRVQKGGEDWRLDNPRKLIVGGRYPSDPVYNLAAIGADLQDALRAAEPGQ